MNNKFEFIMDSILVESIMEQELGFKKNANLFQELNLPGVGESLKNFVKQHVKEDAPGGYVGSILNLMAPSILFRAHPLVGILYLVASQFGFDLQGLFGKIINLLKPKLEAGNKITANEISDIGKSVIAGMAGEPVTAAPDDLFSEIRKYAAPSYFGGSSLPETPLLFGGQGGILQRIFGQLLSSPGRGKSKAIWLLGGFVIWIIKTILVGAGLVAGAEAISGLIKNKTETKSEEQESVHEEAHEQTYQHNIPQETEKKDILSYFPSLKKQNNEMWVVPLLGGNVENTLMEWIQEFYPEKTQDIKNTEIFRSILNQLNDPKKISQKYIIMPNTFSSRREIVEQIVKGNNE